MKFRNLPVALLFLFHIYVAKAQPLKNGDFENWTPFNGNTSLLAPDYWKCYNMLALSNPPSLSIYRSPDAQSGNWALKMTKNSIPSLPNAIRLIDTISYLPQKLVGYYKFHPNTAAHDTVFATVRLWNSLIALPITGDYNAEGNYPFAPANDYTPFEIPLYTNANPFSLDSLRIIFFYGSADTSTNPTGEFFLDDLRFVGNSTSVPNISDGAATISVYPNPASGVLYIDNKRGDFNAVRVYAIDGRIVREQQLFLGCNDVQLQNLPAGQYYIDCTSNKTASYKCRFVKD